MVQFLRRGKKVKYRVNYRDAEGKRHSRVFTTKNAADEFERKQKEIKERVRAGLQLPSSRILLIDYAGHFLRKRSRDPDIAGSTIEADDQRLRQYWLPFFGNRTLESITSEEIKEHLNFLQTEKGYKTATRNRARAVLHTLYNYAKAEKQVAFNPVTDAELKDESEDRRAPRWFKSVDQMKAYLDASKQEGDSFHIFCLLTLTCGLRPGEALAVLRSDINLSARVINVCRTYDRTLKKPRLRPKHKSYRKVPIHRSVLPILKIHLERSPYQEPGHAVVYIDRGQCMSPWTARDKHESTIRRAKLDYITPHELRHSFATQFRKQGGHKDDLQEILGHSSPLVQRVYTHLDDDYIASTTEGMDFGIFDEVGQRRHADDARPAKKKRFLGRELH